MELVELLETLRLSHRTCEDYWYSCPASGECARETDGECDCGAKDHNETLDLVIALLPKK